MGAIDTTRLEHQFGTEKLKREIKGRRPVLKDTRGTDTKTRSGAGTACTVRGLKALANGECM